MATLLSKNLFIKTSKPILFKLTQEGQALALQLHCV